MGARFERRLVCVNQHHGITWETPLQTVKQSLTGPVRLAFSGWHCRWGYGPGLRWRTVGICQTLLLCVIATAVIVGAGTIMSTLFSSSSAVIAMTGGF